MMYNGSKFVFKTFYQIVKYLISRKRVLKKKTKKQRNETNFLFSAIIAQNTTSHAKERQFTEGKVTQRLFSLKHAHIIQLSPEAELNSGVDIPKLQSATK